MCQKVTSTLTTGIAQIPLHADVDAEKNAPEHLHQDSQACE